MKTINLKQLVAFMLVVATMFTFLPTQTFADEVQGNFFEMKMEYNEDYKTVRLQYANMTAVMGVDKTRGVFITRTDRMTTASNYEMLFLESPVTLNSEGQPVIPQNTLELLEVMFMAELDVVNNKVVVTEEKMPEAIKEQIRPYEAVYHTKAVDGHYVMTMKEDEYDRENFIETIGSLGFEGYHMANFMDGYFESDEEFFYDELYFVRFGLPVGFTKSGMMISKDGDILTITFDDSLGYDTSNHYYFD